jgi:hypothetical protein
MAGDRGLLERVSFEHLRGLRDTTGRFLGEFKSPDQEIDEDRLISGQWSFADPRSECLLPTNAAALDQIILHWPMIRQRVGSIRAAFVAERDATRLSALDLWRLANAAVSVVSFNRVDLAAEALIPIADAALFKACVGIKFALRHAEVSRLSGHVALGPFPSAESLWAYIDRERLLIGTTQVCAGPTAMIRDLISVLVDGRRPDAPPDDEPVSVDAARLLLYADALGVWETVLLLERADAYAQTTGDGARLRRTARTMLRDICTAVDFAVTPDVGLARRLIEAYLGTILHRSANAVFPIDNPE